MRTLSVSAPSRVHVALADLGNATFRRYGGAGFALSNPRAEISLHRSEQSEIIGLTKLDEEGQRVISNLFFSYIGDHRLSPSTLTIRRCPRPHAGYGSRTALILAVVHALTQFYNIPASEADQIHLSRRGGTSGVGVHSFWRGGVCWDAGHPAELLDEYRPSSEAVGHSVPPLMMRLPFPEEWEIALFDSGAISLSGKDESEFFRKHTPIDRMAALETIGALYHGVLPAFRCADLELLRRALNKIQSTGFKKAEIDLHKQMVKNLLSELDSCGIACGLSSMGPLVYAIFNRNDSLIRQTCASIAAKMPSFTLEFVDGDNMGIVVKDS